jgi:hypothetical protein
MSASLDLPRQFGGVGLQSLVRAADEEIMRLWASITSDLIKFFKSKDLTIYTELADTLESMDDAEDVSTDPSIAPPIPAVAFLMTVSTRAHAFLSEIPQAELEFTASLVMGERNVEPLGR